MTFGKNRVQFDEFQWFYYKFDRYKVHFYAGGEDLALYTAQIAQETINELEKRFDYYLEDSERINFIVYNKIEDFRQHNIGLDSESDNNVAGRSQIQGNNVFVYYNGDHEDFKNNIRLGISKIIANQLIYGDNWREMIKNSALLSMPDWYFEGLVNSFALNWNADFDVKIKNMVLKGKFSKINHLEREDAVNVGHALWNYISKTKGEKIIPNIVYVARVSRNIESGFLFVLGSSLPSQIKDCEDWYKVQYQTETTTKQPVVTSLTEVKTKKKYKYQNPKLSPDGKYLAYSTNQLDQKKIWLLDLQTGKTKKIFKFNYKLDRIPDYKSPLIGWHPSGEILSVIHQNVSQVELHYYFTETKKKETKPIFKLEKILSFDYSPNGKEMVFSAMNAGQTDIYVYKIGPNIQTQLTNDPYDDLNPIFTDQGSQIVFSSNRISDSLLTTSILETEFSTNYDLFKIAYPNNAQVLKRVTQTHYEDELMPKNYFDNTLNYIGKASGVKNRYLIKFDSIISHIDTTIHYRYTAKSNPISNYSNNILDYDINLSEKKQVELFYREGKNNFIISEANQNPTLLDSPIVLDEPEQKIAQPEQPLQIPALSPQHEIHYQPIYINPGESTNSMNHQNYRFYGEAADGDKTTDNKPNIPQTTSNTADPATGTTDSINASVARLKQMVIPQKRNFHLFFTASDIQTAFDFDFASQIYQHFNGGPYITPGLGSVIKINLTDLMEDHQLEGGIRYSWNNRNIEFFASYEDRKKRLDKKYSFQRQTTTYVDDFFRAKTITNQGKIRLSYPFNEVSSLRGTAILRNDKGIIQSTDAITLQARDVYDNWAGLKLEFIFDDSRARGINIWNGTKLKIWGEHYRIIDDLKTDFTVIGIDFRKYLKIHRNLIWANRFSASNSFGNRKLVYYLGAVDNWVLISDRPKFDFSTNIALDQDFYFQTIATPLRGFIQNARNGNSFAAINSEIRWPIFNYFSPKPLKSEFLNGFQLNFFGDIGTAWTGSSPYSDENSFNTKTAVDGNITVTYKNQNDPIIGGTGFGMRTKVWGYFVRFDLAWGIENGQFISTKPERYISIGLDF